MASKDIKLISSPSLETEGASSTSGTMCRTSASRVSKELLSCNHAVLPKSTAKKVVKKCCNTRSLVYVLYCIDERRNQRQQICQQLQNSSSRVRLHTEERREWTTRATSKRPQVPSESSISVSATLEMRAFSTPPTHATAPAPLPQTKVLIAVLLRRERGKSGGGQIIQGDLQRTILLNISWLFF